MFKKLKKYIPNFLNKKTKPNEYLHYMRCFRLFQNIDTLKYMCDVRFSLLVREMLKSEDSISKEGLAEVNRFVASFVKEIERGAEIYLRKKDEIDKWCIDNRIKNDIK